MQGRRKHSPKHSRILNEALTSQRRVSVVGTNFSRLILCSHTARRLASFFPLGMAKRALPVSRRLLHPKAQHPGILRCLDRLSMKSQNDTGCRNVPARFPEPIKTIALQSAVRLRPGDTSEASELDHLCGEAAERARRRREKERGTFPVTVTLILPRQRRHLLEHTT